MIKGKHARHDWVGRTAVCIASGPSLTDGQVHLIGNAHACNEVKVIAVADNYRKAPWADVVFAADILWWSRHVRDVTRLSAAERWTCDKTAAQRHGLKHMPGSAKTGLGVQSLYSNGNSGAMAINLAALFGATRIILVGYDMQLSDGGRKHWFGDHPKPLVQAMLFPEWRSRMAKLAQDCDKHGIVVLNATLKTALTCFSTCDLEEALDHASTGFVQA